MFRKSGRLLAPIFLTLLAWVTLAQAQTATPPAATLTPQPTATPAATEPPAILVIQPTPVPSPPLQGDLEQQIQQVWQQNREAILLAFILALVTGVLVGVFIQRAAAKVADWAGRLFHFLFDRFAAAPLVRLRYEKEYRQTLAAAVQELQGGNLVERELRLDKMYVPALLTEETRPEPGEDLADRYRTRDEIRRQQRDRAVDPWEAVRRFHRFVVLGGPGAGKTTYLYHLAYMCAHRQRPEVERHIPIFIRFRELVRDLEKVEHMEAIFPKVFADHNFPNASKFIERQLRDGRCLVLLDGLDEVSSEDEHQRMIELVQEFGNRHVRGEKHSQSQNILIISSRKYSYEHGAQLSGFPKTEVMEFNTQAIERFAYNWFEDSTLAGELVGQLTGNQRFLELARNPLLLLLIAYHYERERNLPDLRTELYQHCIRTRITKWNTIRGTHRGRFGENDKWRMLRELALHIFEQEKEGLLWREKLLDWLEIFAQNLRLPKDTTPDMLLEEVARTSGLIQEWAIDRYGFSHQTLQEYFAAEAIERLGSEQGATRLEKYLDNPAWKEVFLLYCGRTDDASPFLRRIVGRAKQSGASRALWLLAGQCLAEGARLVNEPLRLEVADKLVSFLRASAEGPFLPAEESEEAIKNLKNFADDLLPGYVRTLLQTRETADLFLAERLLPHETTPELRGELSRRLVAMAQVERSETRRAAVAALGRLGVQSAETAAALLAGLKEPDPTARVEAARALGSLQQVEHAAVEALLTIHESDPADSSRHAALEALLALGQAEAVGMVFVTAGEFLMGSAAKDADANTDEKPQHRLYLPAYYIDRAPVTNAQFRRFVEAGGYANPAYWSEAIQAGRWKEGKHVDYDGTRRNLPYYWNDGRWNGHKQPVVGVSWYESLAYARWAGKRLPSEAEWEKAARGTDGSIYPWGSEWDPARTNSQEVGLERTTPVGHYSPKGDSSYGVADMAGNVWEWCSTRWGYDYPYTPDDGREDLSGGNNGERVLRGGSWANDKQWARCAARQRSSPGFWDSYRGFRCCCATPSLLPGSES